MTSVTRRAGAVVGLLAVLAPVTMLVTATSAGATFEFSFTERTTNQEFVIGGKATLTPQSPPGPGDSFVIRADLLQAGAVIGFDNVQCTVTFNDNILCNAVFAFTNRGDISGTALLRGGAGQNFPTVFDGVVTGGTFAFRNVHGDAHAVVANQSDTNWTFNLVTS